MFFEKKTVLRFPRIFECNSKKWMVFKAISFNFNIRAKYIIEFDRSLVLKIIEVSPGNIKIVQRKLNLSKVLLRYWHQNCEFKWLIKNKNTYKNFFWRRVEILKQIRKRWFFLK